MRVVARLCSILAIAASFVACSTAPAMPPAVGNAASAKRVAARMYLRSADLPKSSVHQYDFFLKVEDIRGDSSDSRHIGWIDVQAFAVQPPSSGVEGTLTITAFASIASPALAGHVYTGKPLHKARLEVIRYEKGETKLFMSVDVEPIRVDSFVSTLVDYSPGIGTAGETFVFKTSSVKVCTGTVCSTTTT